MKRVIVWLTLALIVAMVGCKNNGDTNTNTGTTSGTGSTSSSSASGAGESTGSSGSMSTGATAQTPSGGATAGAEVTTGSGLKYQDLTVGTGAEAASGNTVKVNYTGWLTNGTKFDSSYDRGQPIEFQIGTAGIIQGWNEGITGMKVGGKRKLTIPPNLAYGEAGRGAVIPPNSTLVFEVELVDVK